jgi:hypothetical protein
VMAMDIMNSPLNKNQERRLEVTLYLVEQGLDEIAGYLRGELPAGEMYKTVSDLSLVKRKDMLAVIDLSKQRIAEIKNEFRLDTRINEVKGIIMGYLGSMWENLHNTRTKNLSGFGNVAPELVDLINRLSQVITNKD